MNQININVNKKKPDDATIERITNEMARLGYFDKALSLKMKEKVFYFVSALWVIGGFVYPPLLMVAVGSLCVALITATRLELHMRKMRKYCEDNS